MVLGYIWTSYHFPKLQRSDQILSHRLIIGGHLPHFWKLDHDLGTTYLQSVVISIICSWSLIGSCISEEPLESGRNMACPFFLFFFFNVPLNFWWQFAQKNLKVLTSGIRFIKIPVVLPISVALSFPSYSLDS